MNKASAIASVAYDKTVSDCIDPMDQEERESYTKNVTEMVVGFGSTLPEAVENGLKTGAISYPESDEPLTLDEVVDYLRRGAVLSFYSTPHGVLITDEN